MKSRIVAAIVIACGLLIHYGEPELRAAEASKQTEADSLPIEISADRLEASDEKKLVIFSGGAVASQGDRVIKADKILLFYKSEDRKSSKEGIYSISKTGELDRIEARGNVIITQGDRVVTGAKAVYTQDEQKIIMTGNAVLQQGKNVIRGEKIEVFLTENRGVVEAGNNQRVKATIFPDEKKTAP